MLKSLTRQKIYLIWNYILEALFFLPYIILIAFPIGKLFLTYILYNCFETRFFGTEGITFSCRSNSSYDLSVDDLRIVKDTNSLMGSLDTAGHHCAEGGAHTVRPIVLGQLHT